MTPPDAASPAAAPPAPSRSESLIARVERESGAVPAHAPLDVWMRSAAHEARAELAERMNRSLRADREGEARRVHYLSMEFLMGRALGNALSALGRAGDFDAAAAAHLLQSWLDRAARA